VAITTTAIAVAGMEFENVRIIGTSSDTQTVGGKTVTNLYLDLGTATGDIRLVCGPSVDIAIRYTDLMRIAKKVKIFRRTTAKASIMEIRDGVVVAQQSMDLEASEDAE